MTASIVLAEIAKAIEIVRPFLPVGSEAAKALGVAFEVISELSAVQTEINPEVLRATLADRLGKDVADILTERFGP